MPKTPLFASDSEKKKKKRGRKSSHSGSRTPSMTKMRSDPSRNNITKYSDKPKGSEKSKNVSWDETPSLCENLILPKNPTKEIKQIYDYHQKKKADRLAKMDNVAKNLETDQTAEETAEETFNQPQPLPYDDDDYTFTDIEGLPRRSPLQLPPDLPPPPPPVRRPEPIVPQSIQEGSPEVQIISVSQNQSQAQDPSKVRTPSISPDTVMREEHDNEDDKNNGPKKELYAMLRLSVNPKECKVLNMLGEFEEFLEGHNFADTRTTHGWNNQKKPDNTSDCDEDGPNNLPGRISEKHPLGVDQELPSMKNNTFGKKLKDLYERIERDGRLACEEDISRNQRDTNMDKDKEDFYAADDTFIDDEEIKVEQDEELSDIEDDSQFYKSFKFVHSSNIASLTKKKRTKKIDGKIRDREINDRLSKLEEYYRLKANDSEALENSEQKIFPDIIFEMVDKMLVSKNPKHKAWNDNFSNILSYLSQIFGEKDHFKVLEFLNLFRDKIKLKSKLKTLFDTFRKEVRLTISKIDLGRCFSPEQAFEKIFGNKNLTKIVKKIGEKIKDNFNLMHKINKYKFGSQWRSFMAIDTSFVDKNLTCVQSAKMKSLDKDLCSMLLKRSNEIYDLFAVDGCYPYTTRYLAGSYGIKGEILTCIREYIEEPMGFMLYSVKYKRQHYK
ncbi:unnamed protein product [Moneuplotes crassus]|uniref:Uncharacterized protein n=1 Tax=Euplotes crassus TaxID=5936 RepID=A0AAD1Y1L3_EUPCR|nr:unnamed protein product [Moneuplotes crassus]